ncbi:hypothetical protein [Dehalogenimonas etheniformans]|uniref:Uncharacterized protein n=1 Tax=Dehalogenimonas etheniformans TaxID=1536648 RepID=A0A2P5P5J4_9CHLR|nr:hypothetical protein [Dehalogenimonas etheniformans]PPD57565.1 hypothetical protein JP09_007395 [Dehalogenimonas etheniformans]QNT75904.1 hypothetical protein HX448_03980 [Dehalogenimonas etheniformans]
MFDLANTNNSLAEPFSRLVEDLPENETYTLLELRSLLDMAIETWQNKSLIPYHLFIIVDAINKRLNSAMVTATNKKPILICYFSPVLTMGAFLTQVFLKTRMLETTLININSDVDIDTLIKELNLTNSPAVIFSFSTFCYVDLIQKRIPELELINTRYYAGGIVFTLKPTLADKLPGFIFPQDLPNLIDSLGVDVQ